MRHRPGGDKAFAILWFLVFWVCMPIAFMNLLVGLAVSDVVALKRDAKITRYRSKLETILVWEYSLPSWLLRRFKILDLLSVRESLPTYPGENKSESTGRVKEAALKAIQPRGFHFYSNGGMFNRIKSFFKFPIDSKLTKEMVENLNRQSGADEVKELLATVKELLTRIPNTK